MNPDLKMLDQYNEQLIGFATLEESIVYVTESTINIVSKNKNKQTAQINGKSVIYFAIGKNRQIALLYKQKYIEIRRAERVTQVIRRIEGINISAKQDYPLLKLIYDDLYLVYPSNIELISLKGGTRNKYSELVRQSQFHKIIDLVLLNFVDSLKICVLHLRNRLVFTIIPCTITEIHIQDINQVVLLNSKLPGMHNKRTYLAILAQSNHIKIMNLINLKQIAQIALQQHDEYIIDIQTDMNCQGLLVRYIHQESQQVLKNVIYKINALAYYKQSQNYFDQAQPFFLYHFQENCNKYLSLLKINEDSINHVYQFYYFQDSEIILIQRRIEKRLRQNVKNMNFTAQQESWRENIEWKEIISTYLQIEDQHFTTAQKKLDYSEQQRQLQQYYQLTRDFDNIIAKFSDVLAFKSQYCTMNQRQIEQEWEEYLEQIAIDKNLLKQTMNLFKLDYQIIKQPNQESCYIDIQLENCMRDMQERESRIDAKIKQKKEELQQQRKRQLQKKQQDSKPKSKLTQNQIKKEQQEYNKFVTEYMAEMEKRQVQEVKASKAKPQMKLMSGFDPRLKLEMPKLNQQQRKLIASSSFDEMNNKSSNSIFNPNRSLVSSQHQQSKDQSHLQSQLNSMLSQIQLSISPLQKSLENLIQKVDDIQENALSQIKQNQEKLQAQMEVNLQEAVKKSCRRMLQKLSEQIKSQLQVAIKKLYNCQQQSVKYYEKSIQKFKQYAKLQVKHKITMFHDNRRKRQLKAQQIAKKQKYQQNISSS